jgi:hypothetical protein
MSQYFKKRKENRMGNLEKLIHAEIPDVPKHYDLVF